jgi:hypothetical protein
MPTQSLARYGRLMEALSSGSTVEGQIPSEKESRTIEYGAEISFFSCGKQCTQSNTIQSCVCFTHAETVVLLL